MAERVSDVVAREWDWMARRIRDELSAAGLSLAVEGADPYLKHPGAEVQVDLLTGGHAPVVINWVTGMPLQDAASRAPRERLLDPSAPRPRSFEHNYTVIGIMQRAIIDILTSAGYAVRESTNDYVPYSVEVLEAPSAQPVWWPEENE